MTNEVREQVSGEQVSREQLSFGRKCLESNCYFGVNARAANVWGAPFMQPFTDFVMETRW